MAKTKILLDSDKDPILFFPIASAAVGPSLAAALSLYMLPRLPALPNIFRSIDRVTVYPRPVAPSGSSVKPENLDASKWKEYLKKAAVAPLTVAFMTLLLNLHLFLPRRVYDGGAQPDATTNALTAIYTLAHTIEALTDVQVSEGLLEGVNEAFTEAFELLLTNPITKFYSLYFGLENADDDEIKDIANAGGITNDTMAYTALMSGLSNVATIAEISTGYLYNLDQNIRNVFRKLTDYADNTVDFYLKHWSWFFNRVISEITEWLTTVGQAAVFHTQRLREAGKRYSTSLAELYTLFVSAEDAYNRALADLREPDADRYLLDMHRLYKNAQALVETMEAELEDVLGMYERDYEKLSQTLDEILEKTNRAVAKYIELLRDYAIKSYRLISFYVNSYKQDMREIIETVARYRSPAPETTVANFEFVEPFAVTGEKVDETI